MARYWLRQWLQAGMGLIGWLAIAPPISAQIVPDNTLPINSTVAPGCTICTIDGGTVHGVNLFHSFERFSVPTGGEAYFNNPAQSQNILTRVTGNLESNIDGLIRANGTADLFLMNPNGIIFGSNASLNVGGSFVATTANAIQFGDQGFFSASNPTAPPLLTINPSAFLFNQLNPGAIQSKASLVVPTGQSLLLVGGSVALEGSILVAQGGRIELGGLAAVGSVGLGLEGNSFRLSFPDSVPRSDISLTKSMMLVPSDGGGDIAITANNVDVAGSIFLAGILPGSGQVGSRAGDITLDATGDMTLSQESNIYNLVFENATGDTGDIFVKARSLTLKDGSALSSFHQGSGNVGNISITTQNAVSIVGVTTGGLSSKIVSQGLEGQGNSGSIQINTRQLFLDGGEIGTSTNRLGLGGNITINARDAIVVKGLLTPQTVAPDYPPIFLWGGITSDVQEDGIGRGGTISLSTNALTVSNGGTVGTRSVGKGDSGAIEINAQDLVLDGAVVWPDVGIVSSNISTNTLSAQGGKGGDIRIAVRTLSILNGAEIDASTLRRGDTGNIFINATDSIRVDGEGSNSSRSAISAEIGPDAIGNGGVVQLQTRNLSLTNGGGIFTVSAGQGNAAAINILAQDSVLIQGTAKDTEPSIIFSGVNQRTFNGRLLQGRGRGGDIRITTGDLRLENEGRILASAISQTGVAADIFVEANTIRLNNQASIATESATSAGGNIFLTARDYILLRRSSTLTTSSGVFPDSFGNGNGGNITITLPNGFLVSAPNENSDITANALGGSGGKVTINAQGIYWFTPRSRAELVRLLGTNDPEKLNPKFLPTNDITAISQSNPELSGVVTLNALGLDPSRGLVSLPTGLVDPSNQIDQRCVPKDAQQASSFTITGRGGVASSPTEPLMQQGALIALVKLPEGEMEQADSGLRADKTASLSASSVPPAAAKEMIEANGWIADAKGNVQLVANAATEQPSSPAMLALSCVQR